MKLYDNDTGVVMELEGWSQIEESNRSPSGITSVRMEEKAAIVFSRFRKIKTSLMM